ncbi:MAG: acyl-CoA carboxylase subunit epsilon [Streptosporangiales bacterium]|nr:acyl-CoA carboxylase subunit epsilon [Streptosporangiales bacterium]
MSERHDPILRVVRGNPSPEQVATLVAVLAARTRAAEAARGFARTARPPSAWRDRSRLLRTDPPRGPGAWRRSAWPR